MRHILEVFYKVYKEPYKNPYGREGVVGAVPATLPTGGKRGIVTVGAPTYKKLLYHCVDTALTAFDGPAPRVISFIFGPDLTILLRSITDNP